MNAIATQSNSRSLAGARQAPRGLEGIGPEDFLLPRIQLVQEKSNFVKEHNLKPGDFVYSTTMESLGNSIEIIPVKATKYCDLLKPEGTRMVFEARVTNPSDPRLKGRRFFRDGELKANANWVLSFLALTNGRPAMLSFKVGSYKAGKMFLTQIASAGGDAFSNKYRLSSKKDSSDGNDYFSLATEFMGPVSDSEFAEAERLYGSLGMGGADLHEMTDSAEETSSTPAPAQKSEELDFPADARSPENVPPSQRATAAAPAQAPVSAPLNAAVATGTLCKKCGKPMSQKEGISKVINPETGKAFGKVKAWFCSGCKVMEVIEVLEPGT